MSSQYNLSEDQIPVSVADLPAHDFSVTPDTLTIKVVEEFENRPTLPGVMIVNDGQLLGVITRLKLFERLGHRFGVELFLQKPIRQLKDLIRASALAIPGYTRIEDAIQFALNRPGPDIYDPVVILRDNGKMQLLDITLLLMAQSHALASLSNIVGNLEQIDQMIMSSHERSEIFNEILQLMRHVVPFHQACILAVDELGVGFAAHQGYPHALNRADEILASPTYQLVMKYRQTIYIARASTVPGWKGMEILGSPLAWIGAPVLVDDQPVGLLSIGRNVDRAFSNDERETVLSFAQRIAETFKRDQRNQTPKIESSPAFTGQRNAAQKESYNDENADVKRSLYSFGQSDLVVY